ncbi:MAG: N-carbamoylputrescine amidase [Proteobacteria bacterium]|nr:N-carbamoylputrescine amidase [Pseudomonadota bacterium]
MTRTLTLGVIQARFGEDMNANIAKVEHYLEKTAKAGAQIALPPELFQGPYFCVTQDEKWFAQAYPAAEHPAVQKLQPVAKALKLAVPVSIFERDGPHYYNSVAMLNADGALMGVYRKSHIPDGPGYCEKFYFRPGNTGYKVWNTAHGAVGVGICWDQWFPECARGMALLGAEILLYPTAIGSEPQDAGLDTRDPWRRAMQGHAVSNAMPVAAANRVGTEKISGQAQSYYGSSFICDQRGEVVAELDGIQEGVITQRFDLDFLRQCRASFGFFRDRREDLGPKLKEVDR